MDLKSLRADIKKAAASNDIYKYWALLTTGLKAYAEETGDELLKKAVLEKYFGGEKTPWGGTKIVEFTIGPDKLVVNNEAETMEGPERIIREIKEANERWQGIRDKNRDDGYIYEPPGSLWNFYALIPLVFRVYGDGVKWRTIEKYPENPLDDVLRELGFEGEKVY